MNNKIIKFQKAGKLPTAATYSLWLKGTFSYLTGIRDRDLVESRYKPSKATDKNTKYYTRKGLDYDVMRNLLGGKESKAKKFDGTPLYYKNFNDLYTRLSNLNGKQLRTTDNSHLGRYTIGIGQDKNGRYVSYYDKFDWAPNESLEIFSPYEIYNRIYEKDFNRMLKELNDEEYSGSNPSGKWFFKSGINNKGYLKKGGLIRTANARKWKHLEGGNIISSEGVDALAGIAGSLFGGIGANKAIKKKRNAINAQNAYAKNAARSQVMGQAQESENQKAVLLLQQFNENSDNGRPSEIVSQVNAYNNAMKILPSYYNQIDLETNALLAELKALKQLNTANMINGIFSAGILYGLDSGLFDKLADKFKLKQLVKDFLKNQKISVTSGTAPKISTGNIALV